jgi:hypothetical protein
MRIIIISGQLSFIERYCVHTLSIYLFLASDVAVVNCLWRKRACGG